MGSNNRRLFRLLQVLGDVLIVNFAIVASFWLRFVGDIPSVNLESYIKIIPAVSVMTFVLFSFYDLYTVSRRSWSEVMASLMASIAVLTPFTIVVSYMVQSFSFPRSVFLLSALLQLVLLSIWRRLIFALGVRGCEPHEATVVAPSFEMMEFAKKVKSSGFDVTMIVTDYQDDLPPYDIAARIIPYVDVEAAWGRIQGSTIFVSEQVPEEAKRIIARQAFGSSTLLYVVPSLYEIMLAQSRLQQIGDTPILQVGVASEPGKEQVKRLFDVVLAGMGLVVASPLMLMAAIAVKLDSPGPVLYRQERVSLGGKTFMVLKFRTMANDAENSTGPVLSDRNDPRVTKVGRVLRTTRIDELPQLVNVLKGEMSLVGPRPERPFFVEQFEEEFTEYSSRHTVKAGITGLAQVAGRYSTPPEDKLKYDLLYAKSVSPLTDLRIMLQTLKVIFMRDKAS